MRAGPGPRTPRPPRRRLRAHCGPARPRLQPAPGPERTALRGPDPRAPGQVAGPPRAWLCLVLLSEVAQPEAPARDAGLSAAGAAAGVPRAPRRRDAFGGGRSERRGAPRRLPVLERGGGGSRGRGSSLVWAVLSPPPLSGWARGRQDLLRACSSSWLHPRAGVVGRGCSLRFGPRGNNLCRGSPRESVLGDFPEILPEGGVWRAGNRGQGTGVRSLGWR